MAKKKKTKAKRVESRVGIATAKGTASAEGHRWLLLGSEALPKLPKPPGPSRQLTAEKIERGDAFVLANPDMYQTDVFDRLRELLDTSVKNSTLWRAFYSKDAKRRRQRFSG
jgi:hypothetical protein